MSIATLLFTLLLATVSPGQPWRTPAMPVEEITTGMHGIGKTVFYGDQVEEFGVEVIDIMKNYYPQRDIIIVRLTGEKAERMGVVAGMSGSPVYINGRLIGALAMRLGDFQKEPIAGVTPFAEMVRPLLHKAAGEPRSGKTASLFPEYLRQLYVGATGDFWPSLVNQHLSTTIAGNRSIRPIESPLVMSGISFGARSTDLSWLSEIGFSPITAGMAGSPGGSESLPLEPGSAVSQVFISGDVNIDAMGTLTAIEENRLLAFGHFIFNLGPTHLPLARSRVLVTLPGLLGSNKIGSAREIVGIVREDFLSGIYGELGGTPHWTPVHLQLRHAKGQTDQFNFSLASDPSVDHLMPFFLRTALFQALVAGKYNASPGTVKIAGDIQFADDAALHFEDFFSYEQKLGFMGAGSEMAEAVDLIAKLIGILQVNDFESPRIKHIALTADAQSGENIARLESLRLNRTKIHPGDSLTATMLLRRTDGTERLLRRSLQLPKNLTTRRLTLVAGGAAAITLFDLQNNPDKYRPTDFGQLRSLIENRRRNNRLYLQVRESSPGLIIDGQELDALPPSLMTVMNGASGEKRLHDRILFEHDLETDFEISGLKRLNLTIIQPEKSPGKNDEEPTSLPIFEW